MLSRHYRGLHHFFRQQFSQVTNPPIDPLREWRVMSLKTRFGNLGNVYDEDPSQTRILQLEPVLTTSEVEAAKAHFGANQRTLDCTFDAGPEGRLRVALERIRQEAEEAVRGGCKALILSDGAVGRIASPCR